VTVCLGDAGKVEFGRVYKEIGIHWSGDGNGISSGWRSGWRECVWRRGLRNREMSTGDRNGAKISQVE
jgi:hypothetical protein